MRSHVAATVSALLACSVLGLAGSNVKASPTSETGKGWEFHKPLSHEPPAVRDSAWPRNAVDNFILGRLEQQGLHPAPEASRELLLRRAYLDLIGLPPTPQQVDAFVHDVSADAFEKVVDGLLATPQYGERWARHWLDLARYAESEGFKSDETRPYAWRYRDYVIQSLNDDKPYDRFLREQIAGDELWPDDPQARIATGFLRHYPDESNARNLYQRRQEILNDDTDTAGAVFLGLTFGCARCHDHKYDPISQADYYRLQAFFAGLRADDAISVATPQQIREHDDKLAVWEQQTKSIREEMAQIEMRKREAILKDYFDKYPPEIQESLLKTSQQRSPMDWVLHFKAAQYLEPQSYQYLAPASACIAGLKPAQKERYNELKKDLEKYDDLKPPDLPLATGIADACRDAPKTYVLRKGVYDAFKEEVQPGFPSAIDSAEPTIVPPAGLNSSGRRTALANWLASPDNPLVARVIVNRVWQYHFGRGIVGTPSDFGAQGERPSHPELLDWLAIQFVRDGGSLKKLHRLIVTSAAYRQSTAPDALAAKIDPEDRLLWRFPRKRLEAEVIRDSALSVAGLLIPKMGGPSVFPEIPPSLEVRGGWPVTQDRKKRNRRSIYIFVRRNVRYPMLEAFDMPDPYETCPRRYMTTTPSQALMLMNNNLTLGWAQHFAGRVLSEAGDDRHAIIDAACRLTYARHASPDELTTIGDFLDRQTTLISERLAKGEKIALPDPLNENQSPAQAAAVVDFCHVLMNSNEFVYSD